MWYAFGGLAVILYVVLIITLGVATLRNGQTGLLHSRHLLPDLLDLRRAEQSEDAGRLTAGDLASHGRRRICTAPRGDDLPA